MMDAQKIHQLISNKEVLQLSDLGDLKMLVDKYPYFQAGLFAYLKSVYLFENSSFNKELKKHSIFVNDRKALFFYILNEEYSLFFTHIQTKKLDDDRTNVLLNAFFETRDMNDSSDLEYNLSHTTLASSDYFSYIDHVEKGELKEEPERSEPAVDMKHQDIIDVFIEKSKEEGGIHIKMSKEEVPTPPATVLKTGDATDDELNDDLFFTETLAKIYIKQKKYDKAHKIIKHLSLNFPKKNVYFADQLSFLEKLIINSKFKDKKWLH